MKNYSDIFKGLEKFLGEPYKLRLKPDSTPAKHRPQKVPLHLQDTFHKEVKRLVKINVLEAVSEPAEWLNNFVVVEKQVNINKSNARSPGHSIAKIWLCIDPKDLNKALDQEPYYSWSIDELIVKFSGAVFFTIINMDKGYWQVILHPKSQKYTCVTLASTVQAQESSGVTSTRPLHLRTLGTTVELQHHLTPLPEDMAVAINQ